MYSVLKQRLEQNNSGPLCSIAKSSWGMIMGDASSDNPDLNGLGSIKNKIVSPENAISTIRSGDRIFVGTACATPRVLIQALENRGKSLSDIQIFHFLTDGAIPHEDGQPRTHFKHKVFFVGMDSREAVRQGQADYIPISIAQVTNLVKNGSITFDVAMIQTSFPDEAGQVSLGISVDITREISRHSRTVIAELNPNMPITCGDSYISVENIDYPVLVDSPIIEYLHQPADAVAEQIARYIARIIDHGSTLQIGLGQIPNEMLKYLTERRDIGIHSDVITDPVVDLIEQGVITGRKKTLHKDQIVTSYCMGTERLYHLIDRNPMFSFHPIDYVCDPAVISRNNKLVSVSQAFAVDLTGQICADQYEGEFYGGVSTQPEFLKGAANSPGGKPIICLRSTTEDGKQSRIRPLLKEGEGVTIPRSDIHYVITEYGMAYLFGKSIRERALALIEISHPSFRSWLLEEGKRLGYIRPDQNLKSKAAYPAEEEREVELKNGEIVLLRPARASDVEGLQNIFYHTSEHDIYTRFFTNLKSLSVPNFEDEVAFMAVVGDREQDLIVGTSCYMVDPSTQLAEVGYMVLPEWQGIGLGTELQRRMAEYAQSRGVRGFKAEVLAENQKMLKLAQGAPDTSMELSSGVYEITMLFE